MQVNVVSLDLTPIGTHKFRNFAEEVWCEYRENARVEVDLHAVDHGRAVLVIASRKGLKGRIRVALNQLIRKHMLEGLVRVEDGDSKG